MLSELSIRNVAIIDNLQLSFDPGLNVLSGETGAGKSIIIDALTLVCGGRASTELIRSGEDEAIVEAIFDLHDNADITTLLQESGIQPGEELLIKRTLSRTGKNRVYINGSLATLTQLAELGRRLVTIHGQHESQGLLRPEYHLTLLDSFAGTNDLRRQVAAAFDHWRQIADQLTRFDDQEQSSARRLDLLTYQVEEILAANLHPGEEEQLEEQQRLLVNAERLAGTSGSAYEALYGGDLALLGELKRVTQAVRELTAIDPALTPVHTALEESYLQLEDTALQLRDYAGRIEADPAQLQQVSDRLDLLQRLKRKYAPSIEEIIALGQTLAAERDELHTGCHSREELEQHLQSSHSTLTQLAKELSRQRHTAAARLEQLLVAEIRQLAMPHAEVQIRFEPFTEPRATGSERVEFLFSPNPGEIPRPLGKVASGGELSRLMLAFKQILPEGEAPTLVFDEVDTGVGGSVAGVVGRKLRHVADGQQVFCITHLPQVAAWATSHLKVIKQIQNGRTHTVVNKLDNAGQTQEIARMLAGEQITDAALHHAAELISSAVLQ